jgi:hypothetical protein
MVKKLIFIFTIYLFSQSLKAQAFSVGNTCCNYNLVNKTFVIPSSTCATASDFYGFDIDGDVAEDLRITSFNSPPCFAGGAQSKGIMITTTTGCEYVYSTAATCPYRFPMNLAFGTPLTTAMNWSVYPATWNIGQASPYLYYEYINPSSFSYTCSAKANPFYVGFRKILSVSDTIYGWIQMNTYFPGALIDYAYIHTNLAMGIDPITNDFPFIIFPNPSSGQFKIKGMKEETVFISNELGQEIEHVKLNKENNYSMEITELQSGVYFIGNNSVRQKIVVIK